MASTLPSFYLLLLLLPPLALFDLAVTQEEDLVVGLPGQPVVSFRHYSGYVKPEAKKEKALFYWFFEAQSHVARKPLVLWLNGGPGCSSISYGASQELGPFLVRSSSGNLTLNNYSWNKAANLLFLESPVGVGFSYTNRSSDLRHLGDKVTARDSYHFLLNWFKRFPRFRSHEFYLSGESYAGHYVPQLADLIHEGNKRGDKDAHINLKGIMIGNSVLNEATDQLGMVEYAWSHAIISNLLYKTIRKDCGDFRTLSSNSPSCSSSLSSFMEAYEDIDIYSIYSPVCIDSSSAKADRYHSHGSPLFLFSHPELWSGGGRYGRLLRAGYDPCTGDYTHKYFNRADVQKALHANTTNLPYPHTGCSSVIERWNDSPSTVLPIIRKLAENGLRVWIYSGDTDGRVPVTSTRYSLEEMRMKTEGKWRAWYDRKQVAGWVVEYEHGVTFATVHGAGHQVPVFKPRSSLSLLYHFLAGRALPATRF